MSTSPPEGLDAEGFILTLPAVQVQSEFKPLLEDVCTSLAQPELGIDGLYLYGSAAAFAASPGLDSSHS